MVREPTYPPKGRKPKLPPRPPRICACCCKTDDKRR